MEITNREIIRGSIIGLVLIVGLFLSIFALGSVDVIFTKIIGKAKQDAKREVFEQSNSFTKAKRQEIIKYYKEWQSAETIEEKIAIENILSMSLADFDEDKYIRDFKLLVWIKEIKY